MFIMIVSKGDSAQKGKGVAIVNRYCLTWYRAEREKSV